MENKKYNRVMERVEVTPEMRARILANIEKADVSPVRRKAAGKIPLIIGIAAALLVVSFGIYGIMQSGSKSSEMKTDSATAGIKHKAYTEDIVDNVVETEVEAEDNAETGSNDLKTGSDLTKDKSDRNYLFEGITDGKTKTAGENTLGVIANKADKVDIKELFKRISVVEYKTAEDLTVKVSDKETVDKFILALTRDYEETEDEMPAEASKYDLTLEGSNLKFALEVYGDQLKVLNKTYRAPSSNLESVLKSIVLKEDQ